MEAISRWETRAKLGTMLNKIAYISPFTWGSSHPLLRLHQLEPCQPVGKWLSGRQVSTQPVCPGERPALKSGNSYEFLCYATTGIFNFVGARIDPAEL